jgi:hypothetical protein
MKTSSPTWLFHRHRPGDAWDGMGIQMVIKPELDNFVREVVQNVIDQRAHDEKAATVEFVVRDHVGADADHLLALIGWDKGLEKHMSGVAGGDNHLSEKLKVALAAARDRSIRTLTIRDSATRGLTGPETDGGNFANLCRHVMVTEHGGKARGGAFGIGKSVLWAFSRGSLVFFSSRFFDEELETVDDRLIGRCFFPSHRTDAIAANERYEGNAWFGNPVTTGEHQWICSLRASVARNYFSESPLDRSESSTGTSIMIPFFGSPVDEEDLQGHDLKNEIRTSIAKWFWPAIHGGLLEAHVEYVDIQGNSSSEQVELEPWILPFVRALDLEAGNEVAEEPGSCATGEIDLRIPERRARKNQHPSMNSQVSLNVTRLTEQEISTVPEALSNRVALVRGVRMVVQYLGGLSDSLPPFVGLLKAGTLHGESESDKASEYFLRDSEPPAHDKWESTAKLRENYKVGGIAALNGLLGEIRSRAKTLLGTASNLSSKSPRKLAELLKGRKRGPEKPPGGLPRIMISNPVISRDGITVTGKCKVRGPLDKPWSINLRLVAKTEDNGKVSLDHAISMVTIAGGDGATWALADSEVDRISERIIVPGIKIAVPEGKGEFQVEFTATGDFLGSEVMRSSRVEVSTSSSRKTASSEAVEENSDG